MNNKIENQLQRIDAKLQKLLADLEQHSVDTLQRKPSPNGWSVLEVLQHLMLVENASEKYVRKKLSFNPKLPKVNIGTAWRMMLLKSYNWIPIKLKAPAYVNENNFSATATFTEIRKEWISRRQALREYLTTLPEDIFNREVYKHPLVGRMSLHGMLQFFEGHFDRHHRQIRKLLEV